MADLCEWRLRHGVRICARYDDRSRGIFGRETGRCKIYTKEYTEYLETKLLKLNSEIELLKEAKQVLLQIDLRNNGKCYNNGVLDNCQCTLCKINKFLENADR